MDAQGPRTLQEIIRRRQQGDFVGRDDYLSDFRHNLALPIQDDRRRFIYNVHGPPGIGKTSLLRRFSAIAQDAGLIVAWTDDSEGDVLGVMEQIATGFEARGRPLAALADRLRAYRQWSPSPLDDRRERVDPRVTQGYALVKGGVLAASTAVQDRLAMPGAPRPTRRSRGGLEVSRADPSADGRVSDSPDEPVRTLTPLLVDSLRVVARSTSIGLFFDGYERTSVFLDGWLPAMLDGQFGDLPAALTLVVAGQHRLDIARWGAYEGLIRRIALDAFTEDEARVYLARSGVRDERIVDNILRVSSRLPVLVATMALGGQRDDYHVDDSQDAASHFLQSIDDAARRAILLDAALPRHLDADLLQQVIGRSDAGTTIEWLRRMPFVQQRAGEWIYRAAVRAGLLRHVRRELPERWVELHARLAEYFERLMDALNPGDADRRQNSTWQSYALESLYHRLCQSPRDSLGTALSGFVPAFGIQIAFARLWAETILQAGQDADDRTVREWGERFVEGVAGFADERFDLVARMFGALLESKEFDGRWRLDALSWRCRLLLAAGDLDAAARAYDSLVPLAPGDAQHWIERGVVLARLGHYEAAIADFSHALELLPGSVWALANRGETYRLLERYEEALADLSAVLEREPSNAVVLGSRGQIYLALERYDLALTDLDLAVQREPDEWWIRAERGNAYRQLGRYDEALADVDHALRQDPDNIWVLAVRGDIQRRRGQFDAAQQDFDRALSA